jgi:cobalt-zinc-cadmium efflux system outer membrane protein
MTPPARPSQNSWLAWIATLLTLAGCTPVDCWVHSDGTPNVVEMGAERSLRLAAHQETPAEGVQKENAGEVKQKITLPLAVELCINQNFRLRVGEEKVRQAEADLITASLIPNPSLYTDAQLIPLQRADINNQLGPPQFDALLTVPIDWLIFGKRAAARQAAQLGIEVSEADFADLHRVQIGRTVDAFYEVLADQEYFKLAEKNLEELQELEKVIEEMAKNKNAGGLELDRIKLAVHEALLDRHDRELALELARARLRPFLGRTAADPDYEVTGTLAVSAVVPPPKLTEAIALAEEHRPDLISDLRDIARAQADVRLERRKAKPRLDIVPGWSYQDQHHITGFRNGSLFDIGLSTSLPLTDRNQGNIHKALSRERENHLTYLADRADALAEVEAAVASYTDAVEHLTQFNTPATMKAARDLEKNMAAAYRAGDRRLIDVLDAHRAYRDRLAHVVEFESTYWRELNRLNVAVGLKAYDPDTAKTEPVGK